MPLHVLALPTHVVALVLGFSTGSEAIALRVTEATGAEGGRYGLVVRANTSGRVLAACFDLEAPWYQVIEYQQRAQSMIEHWDEHFARVDSAQANVQ